MVAIVGRPNVGKSALFNCIVGKMVSIVEDTPGVTRDRIYAEIGWRDRSFTLIDTGGIEPYTQDEIMQQMKRQAEVAIDAADVIIFLVDAKDGLTATDKEVSAMLRKTDKPLLLVANKVDQAGEMPADVYEFYNLGMGDILPVSSVHRLGIGDLLDEVYKNLPEETGEEYGEDVIKVAVVGKPNVGKSSLINKILKEDRVIVSDVAGTTRDAIDTLVTNGDDKFVFIDTAGIRKQSKIDSAIERYSVFRSWTAIERADVCLVMLDAEFGITEQDSKIAGYAHDTGKASIIVVNKWDVVEKDTKTSDHYKAVIEDRLKFMAYSPKLFISAMTGQRVSKIFDMVKEVSAESNKRIPTGILNQVLNEAVAAVQPPSDKGRMLKVYYMTQTGTKPPEFTLFVNDVELMHYSYKRYIENQIRKNFGFAGTPIKFNIREKDGR